MSSSCRSVARVRPGTWLVSAQLAIVLPAAAQEVAFIPQGDFSEEYSTNRNLTVPAGPNSELFRATVGGDLIRRTLVSDLDFRPLLTVQHDDKISSLDNWEALVDLVGDYRTLRSESSFIAEYRREDAYNSQYGITTFNPLNPNAPDTAGTGAIVTGITRTTYEVAPEFSYDFTQRVSLTAGADLMAVRYNTDVPGQLVSYNSPQVGLALGWAVNPTTRLELGPYYAYYNPVNDTEGAVKTTTYGVSVDLASKISTTSQSRITARVEHDTEPAAFGQPSFSDTIWGLEWVGFHKFLTSRIQYSIGRFLQPGSEGGRSESDQVRVQYNRDLSQRWSLTAAVRLTRNTDIGTVVIDNSDNRDRANALLSVSYLFTPEWFMGGGYRYA
ncbi:MAG TPA: hypothetical protein VI653_18170, partial [Steroidobacteraceae bacterium]